MEGADVHSPVSEEAQRDAAVAEVLGREGSAECDRQMGAHDREGSVGADGDVGEVHRAALAAAQAAGLADDLGKRAVGRCPHRQHRPVPAIGAEHRVSLAQGAAGPDDHGLLPLAEVRGAAHETGCEEPLGGLLEGSYLAHPLQECRRCLT